MGKATNEMVHKSYEIGKKIHQKTNIKNRWIKSVD